MSASQLENPARIEPVRLLAIPETTFDLATRVVIAATKLEKSLHPKTAENLADLVRIMNSYYSNRIEGHHTRPHEIEDALAGRLEADPERRDLQREAAAHVRLQGEIDRVFSRGVLGEPAAGEYLRWLHAEFYRDATPAMLTIKNGRHIYRMEPGVWRSEPQHDNVVGRHSPPSSTAVAAFMEYFAAKYRFADFGEGARVLAIGPAHHRFTYIHPFPDGNGRVARLMSHAMAQKAGIGAHGLWSIARGLARGLDDRGEYMQMMDAADAPRSNDTDGRGNLSLRALEIFTDWFLRVCLDQITFMSTLFELNTLGKRLTQYVNQHATLAPETARLLTEALQRGEVLRRDIPGIVNLPERSARRVVAEAIADGILASTTPKGPVFLRFPTQTLEIIFPRLFV